MWPILHSAFLCMKTTLPIMHHIVLVSVPQQNIAGAVEKSGTEIHVAEMPFVAISTTSYSCKCSVIVRLLRVLKYISHKSQGQL